MHRRQFLYTATLAAAAPMAIAPARAAQVATPSESDSGLADRIARVPPETLLEALLTTPITTPLVPADLAGIAASPWEDTSDSDLDGAVGGVTFAVQGSEPEVLAGNAIVHPDADAAAASLQEVPSAADSSTFLDLPWVTLGDSDYAVSAVRVGYLVVGGGAETEYEPDAAPDATTTRKLRIQAIDRLVMLVDHLDDVLATLGT